MGPAMKGLPAGVVKTRAANRPPDDRDDLTAVAARTGSGNSINPSRQIAASKR